MFVGTIFKLSLLKCSFLPLLIIEEYLLHPVEFPPNYIIEGKNYGEFPRTYSNRVREIPRPTLA